MTCGRLIGAKCLTALAAVSLLGHSAFGQAISRLPAALGGAPLPRCYGVMLGEWTVGSEPPVSAEFRPVRVELNGAPYSGLSLNEAPYHSVPSLLGEHDAVWWYPDSSSQSVMWLVTVSDSIEIVRPNWGIVLGLTVVPHHDSLIGTALVHADYFPYEPTTAPAILVPAVCPK